MARTLSLEGNVLTVALTPDEVKLVQQTIDTKAISTYLRVDPDKEQA